MTSHDGRWLTAPADTDLVALVEELLLLTEKDLTAHHIGRPERANSFQHLGLFVP